MAASHLSGPLFVGGIPIFGSAQASYFGRQWFVDTVNGSDSYDGKSPETAFQTMGACFYIGTVTAGEGTTSRIGPNDTIWVRGTIREQLLAPLTYLNPATGTSLAVTGVSINGMVGGMVRDDDGTKWTYPTSGATAGMALLRCRQQGWAVRNMLMTPEPTSGAAIELRRAEDATNPDGSHFIADNCKFIGIDVTTTYGIRDIGGTHNNMINNCQFVLLTTGLYCSSTSIAVPLRWQVLNNTFRQNTNDIIVPSSYSLFQGNRHFSTAATEKVEISGGGFNVVTGNVFPNDAADIDPGNGYDGNADDTWTGNLVANQAAFVFGDPA